MTRVHVILVAALTIVTTLAIAGWLRKPATTGATLAAPYGSNPEPAAAPNAVAQPVPAATYDAYGQPIGPTASAGQPAYPPAGEYATAPDELPPYAVPRYVRTVRAQPEYEADRDYAPPPAYAPVYVDRENRDHRHHHRSTARSAEIVAGSAGVGAAVGAIAGGGKGAGIGALAGGAGGFIYDRLTHDH
jgi:hypothetical protein